MHVKNIKNEYFGTYLKVQMCMYKYCTYLIVLNSKLVKRFKSLYISH